MTKEPIITMMCDKHGESEVEYTGMFVQSPLCKKCLLEFKEMVYELVKDPDHIIPIV